MQPTFPRGPGPLVSILFPSRGRPEHLCAAVDSLYSLCRDKSNLEFIFKADTDDQPTIDALARIESLIPVKKIISPRGNGYRDMHLWVNEMARMATGDWLMIFNDDARMRTQDWDQKLLYSVLESNGWHGVHDVICIAPSHNGEVGGTAFFFLRRKVVEILGRFSYTPHNDTWVSTMMRMCESMFYYSPIDIFHAALNENTALKDKTYEEGNTARASTAFNIHHKDACVTKILDALKLRLYIDMHPSRIVKEPA